VSALPPPPPRRSSWLLDRFATHSGTVVLAGTGRRVSQRAFLAGRAVILFIEACRFLPQARRSLKLVVRQLENAGVGSLFVLALITAMTGAILAMQVGFTLQAIAEGELAQLGGIISVSFCREFGPMWAAVIVLARVGAAMAAELGTMTVNEEVDALRAMSIDPVRYLVMPRILALVVAMPVLALVGNIIGILGGLALTHSLFHQPTAVFWGSVSNALSATDVISGLVKAAVFGAIIGTIACDRGLNTSDGAEGVGRSTTVSVVLNVIFVLFADLVITWFVSVPFKAIQNWVA
jgi:phospholipid/cholesterol/gamma-HCH transport system permease protein